MSTAVIGSSSPDSEQCRDWVGHVIVRGLNPVGLRTVEQLHLAGARVVVLDDEQSFDFRHVWSSSAIAAPWFVGAALGLEVLFTFYVGNHPFLLARLRVTAGGGLDGLAMLDLPGRIRVVTIRRAGDAAALEHPPRRETRLAPDDDAYLVGPYAELLEVLRHDREEPRRTAAPSI